MKIGAHKQANLLSRKLMIHKATQDIPYTLYQCPLATIFKYMPIYASEH